MWHFLVYFVIAVMLLMKKAWEQRALQQTFSPSLSPTCRNREECTCRASESSAHSERFADDLSYASHTSRTRWHDIDTGVSDTEESRRSPLKHAITALPPIAHPDKLLLATQLVQTQYDELLQALLGCRRYTVNAVGVVVDKAFLRLCERADVLLREDVIGRAALVYMFTCTLHYLASIEHDFAPLLAQVVQQWDLMVIMAGVNDDST